MSRYAIRLPDGSLITDPEWHSPADVMRGAHGQDVTRMPGELIRLDDHPATRGGDPMTTDRAARETTEESKR